VLSVSAYVSVPFEPIALPELLRVLAGNIGLLVTGFACVKFGGRKQFLHRGVAFQVESTFTSRKLSQPDSMVIALNISHADICLIFFISS
jgi:hypothetical protein